MEEEWPAHLAQRDGRLTMMAHALGCLVASFRMETAIASRLAWQYKYGRELFVAVFGTVVAKMAIKRAKVSIENGKRQSVHRARHFQRAQSAINIAQAHNNRVGWALVRRTEMRERRTPRCY